MLKKALMLTMVLVMLATSFVYADADQSILSKITGLSDQEISALNQDTRDYRRIIAASVLSKLTGKTVEDIIDANKQGKTLFEIAKSEDVQFEEYRKAMLDTKLAYVDEQVKAGTLTEEQGKIIKERLTQNIENCNGHGLRRIREGISPGMGRGIRGHGIRFSSSL